MEISARGDSSKSERSLDASETCSDVWFGGLALTKVQEVELVAELKMLRFLLGVTS